MALDLSKKYAELKTAAADSANMDVVNDLMVDILQMLHDEFTQTAGQQRDTFEGAYSRLDCTFSAHQSTTQNTHNPYYVSELSTQVGRDIATVLQRRQRSGPIS